MVAVGRQACVIVTSLFMLACSQARTKDDELLLRLPGLSTRIWTDAPEAEVDAVIASLCGSQGIVSGGGRRSWRIGQSASLWRNNVGGDVRVDMVGYDILDIGRRFEVLDAIGRELARLGNAVRCADATVVSIPNDTASWQSVVKALDSASADAGWVVRQEEVYIDQMQFAIFIDKSVFYLNLVTLPPTIWPLPFGDNVIEAYSESGSHQERRALLEAILERATGRTVHIASWPVWCIKPADVETVLRSAFRGS